MQKVQLLVLISCLLCLVMVGCTEEQEKFIAFDNYVNTEEATTIEKELTAEDHVDKAIAIIVEDELLIAVQVNPWQKWRKTKIEENLQKKYEKQYPSYNVLVSADYKIYFEASKFIDNEEEDLAEKIKELKNLAKEET